MRRLFGRNDEAVTEVIGYVLSFALSAIFLLIALNVFYAARGNTEHVVTGVELKTLADRVASHIVEMGFVSQDFPDSRLDITLIVPQSLSGRLYTVTATPFKVTASTNDGELTAQASTYKTDVLTGVNVVGQVDSSNERILLTYLRDPAQAPKDRIITIHGE